jgi:hypothetical protein
MISVWLTMVICTGSACQIVELPIEGGVYACAMGATPLAQAWIAKHAPGATLRRWRCEYGQPL